LSSAIGDITITYSAANTEIRDFGGNNVATDVTGVIIDLDSTNPSISSTTPTDNGTAVGINQNLVLTFTEAVDVETGNISIKRTSDDVAFETIALPDGRVSGTGTNSITINPTGTFVDETSYYVLIDATAFDDPSKNSYAGISVKTDWNFTTADIFTQLPALATPASSSSDNLTLDIDFSLPETAASGTVKMTFTQTGGSADANSPHVITFGAVF